MKLLFVLSFLVGSFANAADVCLEKVTTTKSERGYAARSGIEAGSGRSYSISFARVRCMCLENDVAESIEVILDGVSSLGLSEGTQLCLVDADIYEGNIGRASGFYFKRNR